jgi:hypothetical protein
VQINVISEFKIYLSQLSGQLDIIVDEDHIEVSESKEFFNSMAKLRSFQAIALIKRYRLHHNPGKSSCSDRFLLSTNLPKRY